MKISTLFAAALLLGSTTNVLADNGGALKFENVIQKTYSQISTPIAVTSEGNVVVTSTQIADDALGSFVAMATSELASDAVWTVNITGGRSVVNAIVADSKGGVYIGGDFNDNVTFGSVLGGKTLTGKNSGNYTKTNAFVAHITKDGTVDAAYAFVPVANPEMVEKYETYSQGDKVYCNLSGLAIVDGKLYAGLIFTDVMTTADGNTTLTTGTWDGAAYGWGIGSDADFAIAELDQETLGAKSFPVVFGGKGTYTDSSYLGINVESAKLAADGNKLYFAATVNGYTTSTSLTVFGEEKDTPTFAAFGGINAVYVAGVNLDDKTCTSKVYDGKYSWSPNASSLVQAGVASLTVEGDELYVGGSFIQSMPFNTDIKANGNTDLYLAGLGKDDLSVKFAIASGYDEKTADSNNEEKFAGYTIDGNNVSIYGAVAARQDIYTPHTASAPLLFTVSDYANAAASVTDASATATDFTTGTVSANGKTYTAKLDAEQATVYYQWSGNANAIESVNADGAKEDAVYNLQGMKLTAPQKGLNIVNGKAVLVK